MLLLFLFTAKPVTIFAITKSLRESSAKIKAALLYSVIFHWVLANNYTLLKKIVFYYFNK